MRDEYDFTDAKPAADIPALERLTAGSHDKTRITINIDSDILDAFRRRADELGRPYQPMINAALRDYLAREGSESLEATLRRVIREELKPAAEA
jgi:uncharacterized protein (DUF4415 family)